MSKITIKGQITIPKTIRDRLGLQPGEEVEFLEEGDRIYLARRPPRHRLEAWVGTCDLDSSVDDFVREMRE